MTTAGVKLPEMTLDLTGDDFLGVAREEFVKSIKQFLKVEAEMYPVFIISKPGSECVAVAVACVVVGGWGWGFWSSGLLIGGMTRLSGWLAD